jgi:hypothetical protein
VKTKGVAHFLRHRTFLGRSLGLDGFIQIGWHPYHNWSSFGLRFGPLRHAAPSRSPAPNSARAQNDSDAQSRNRAFAESGSVRVRVFNRQSRDHKSASLTERPKQQEGGAIPMGRTSEKCPTSGIWRSNCSDNIEIALSKGDTFPPCRNHGAVNWTLIRATVN